MCARPLEKRMACGAGGRFDRTPLQPRTSADVFPVYADRPVERFGELPTEPLVVIGRGAQLMVEMGETDDTQFVLGVEILEEMRQRDRIGAARQRYDDPRVAAGQLVLAD